MDKKDKEMIDRLISEAQAKHDGKIGKRAAQLFATLDEAVKREAREHGNLESAAIWTAIAALVAKLVMVQEVQSDKKNLFDELIPTFVEAVRATYKAGYTMES